MTFQSINAQLPKTDFILPVQSQQVSLEIDRQKFEPLKQTQYIAETLSESANIKSNNEEIKLKLPDVVFLVLEHNRTVKNAYLERIVQKADLEVAEDEFAPDFIPTLSVSLGKSSTRDNSSAIAGDIGLKTALLFKIPTGGEFEFTWSGKVQDTFQNDSNETEEVLNQLLEFRFRQPLLRGAGINLNRVSIETARQREKINLLNLKAIVIDTIAEVIIAYRELVRAQEELKIEQLSLNSAKELLEFNQFLIEAGRLAPVDIVQSETAVANRKVSVLAAKNNLESAKLGLLDILDIKQNSPIVAAEISVVEPIIFDFDTLKKFALDNKPQYLQAKILLEVTKLEFVRAKNNRLWDLSLSTSYNSTLDNEDELKAELALSRELGNLSLERDVIEGKINYFQAKNDLKEARESLENQLVNNIRDITLNLSQIELARQATKLSEKQLEIEREKQQLGRGSNIFELIDLQDDLRQARNVELNSKIDYLNSLTRLDRTIGRTLDTWQVQIESK